MGKDLKGKELGTGISQRSDGRYVARFKKDGISYQKVLKTLQDARKWLADSMEENLIIKNNVTVDAWFNSWIDTYKQDIVAENTTKNYKCRYEANIKNEIGKKKLNDVTHMDCQKILNKMYNRAYALGTIQQTRITLHAMFKDAVLNKYMKENPAQNLVIKTKTTETERRVLSNSEQKEFIKYAQNTMYYNAFALALNTGLRQGEVSGLQWRDIDFEKRTLHVNRTLLDDPLHFGKPKTKSSKRIIPLTDTTIEILQDQKRQQRRLMSNSKNWDHSWDGLVFTTVNGKPVGGSTYRVCLTRIVENINKDRRLDGIEEFEHIYMHSLRHTFATRMIERGMTPKVLQKILGHSILSTTMDLYVHVSMDQEMLEMERCTKGVQTQN